METIAERGEFFGFDIADNVDQDSLFMAVDYGHDHTLDRVRAACLQINPHIFFLLLGTDDSFPPARVELGANGFDSILDIAPILVVQPDHVHSNGLQPFEQVHHFGLRFGRQLGHHRDEIAVHVYFDELAPTSVEFAEIDEPSGVCRVNPNLGEACDQSESKSRAKNMFHIWFRVNGARAPLFGNTRAAAGKLQKREEPGVERQTKAPQLRAAMRTGRDRADYFGRVAGGTYPLCQ